MTTSIRLRRGRAARPVAATLATVLLALSIGAGFHRGDHDDMGWLPSRFHLHDYELQAASDDAPLALVDHCLACNVSRTLVRFVPPVPPVPESPLAEIPAIRGWIDAATDRSHHPRTPRAPPA